jgi:hypothetical protein
MYTTISFSIGCLKITDFQLNQLARAKQPKFLIFVACMIMGPAIIGIAILLSLYPSLAHCYGCEPYREILITLLCVNMPNIVLIGRLAFVGYRQSGGRDAQGVIHEFALFLIFVCPLLTAAMLLEIIDPGNVDYNYQYAWEWLIMFSGFVLWCIVIFLQVVIAFRRLIQNRRVESLGIRDPGAAASEKNMLSVILNENDKHAKDFENYAARNLVIELLHFLQDVDAFKRFFAEKGDSWRLQKAKLLVSTYIRQGSAAELNVSDVTRKNIYDTVRLVENSKGSTSILFSAFDEAYRDAARMLNHGVWIRYIRMKKKRHSVAFMELDHSFTSSSSPSMNNHNKRIAPSSGSQEHH